MCLTNDKKMIDDDSNIEYMTPNFSENLSYDSSDENNLIPFHNGKFKQDLIKSFEIKDKPLYHNKNESNSSNIQIQKQSYKYFQPFLKNQIQNIDSGINLQHNNKSNRCSLFLYKSTFNYFMNTLNNSLHEICESADSVKMNLNNKINKNINIPSHIKIDKEINNGKNIARKVINSKRSKKLEIYNNLDNSVSLINMKKARKSSLEITGLQNNNVSFYNKKVNKNVNNFKEYMTPNITKNFDVEEIDRNLQKKLQEKNSQLKQLNKSSLIQKKNSKLINYPSFNCLSKNDFQKIKKEDLKFIQNTSNYDSLNYVMQNPQYIYGCNLCLLNSLPSSNYNYSSLKSNNAFSNKNKGIQNAQDIKKVGSNYFLMQNYLSHSEEINGIHNKQFETIKPIDLNLKRIFNDNNLQSNLNSKSSCFFNLKECDSNLKSKNFPNQHYLINKSQNINSNFLNNKNIKNNPSKEVFNKTTFPIEQFQEYLNNNWLFKTSNVLFDNSKGSTVQQNHLENQHSENIKLPISNLISKSKTTKLMVNETKNELNLRNNKFQGTKNAFLFLTNSESSKENKNSEFESNLNDNKVKNVDKKFGNNQEFESLPKQKEENSKNLKTNNNIEKTNYKITKELIKENNNKYSKGKIDNQIMPKNIEANVEKTKKENNNCSFKDILIQNSVSNNLININLNKTENENKNTKSMRQVDLKLDAYK